MTNGDTRLASAGELLEQTTDMVVGVLRAKAVPLFIMAANGTAGVLWDANSPSSKRLRS
jgi:hypothetical protein